MISKGNHRAKRDCEADRILKNLEFIYIHTNKLLMIKYTKLNVEYPECPFIWHYDDMANIYPVAYCDKLNYEKMVIIAESCENKFLKDALEEIKDNADFYVIGQYKHESHFYNAAEKNEIYISFHTWLYKYLTEKDTIDDTKLNVSFDISSGIFPLIGEINHVDNYPFRTIINKKKKKITKILVGMSINNIIKRDCIIHDSKGYIRFSPHNQCNILLDSDSDDFMFVSIIKNVSIEKINDESPEAVKLDRTCVTLHIFRNKYDNDPKNIVFAKMLELVKS